MDVWNLSDHLGSLVDRTDVTNDEIGKILGLYETERIPFGSKELLESRQNAARFHSASPLTIFFRNTIMRLVNSRIQFDAWFNRKA